MNTNRSTPTNSSNKTNSGSRSIGRLIMQLRRLERQPLPFGDAGTLTPSEIHTIEAIGMEGGVLMSELASRLGVTKGAITQLVARLQAKNLIHRAQHPSDSRGSLISLTRKGQEALTAHEEMHLRFYDQLRAQLSEQEIEIFERCVDKFADFLEK
ncbi:MarR family transcriptional regulator [uncultured Paenibacillus sp.]|uniref:MarR family winged helix-turn-helix transcriptional regulator n=1 Tax=uncultured Paenibacillus sp. TaxID=227322 RepID=UPI0015AB1C07|nr:MarR family transcriptional regulator [uncultured Paenibacillus sp.]